MSSPQPPASDRPVLLLVEDHDPVRRALTRALGTTYDVHAASTAEEGLRSAGRARPDVVLTDLIVPGGLDALLTGLSAIGHLPVIVMSGDPEQLAAAAVRPGVAGAIDKPFSLADLESALSAVCRPRGG